MIPRRVAIRVYSFLLRAFPRRHRRSYRAEMIDAFERELAARMRNGDGSTVIRFVLAAWLNVISAGIGERQRHRQAGHMSTTFLASLDVILAWRMLLRYPGLTVVSVFGMAVGIGITAGAFMFVRAMMDPIVPLAEGDRVVSVLNWDASTNNRELRLLRDFESWRELTSLQDVGISRNVARNLIVDKWVPETVAVAELSAAAFRVARVAAVRGRYLLPEDERAGAPDVVVIGHGEWLGRFGADPAIVGRTIQLGSTAFTIIGVMPEGFGFPVNHSFWIPWRLDASAYAPRTGPMVDVFARLAPEATIESAQAELNAIGQRMAATWPDTHQHLRGRVMPYTHVFSDMDDPLNALAVHTIQVAFVLLLIVVCVNVAILVYARTVTRQGEIAVRGALGASRRRIIAQLFVEASMLAGVAAALGIGLLSVVLRQLERAMLPIWGRLPFWITFELSAGDLIDVATFTLLAAAIVGVVPALKATGRQVQTGLQGLSPGSGSRMQMGRVWTTLIVAQVALTVALLPTTMFQAWSAVRFRTGDAGFASQQFLTARVELDRAAMADPSAADEREYQRRYALAHSELERQLRSQAAVSDVTFSMVGPGEELALVLEVEGQPLPVDPARYNIEEGTTQGHLVRFNRVAINFFDAFSIPMLMGRGFEAADAASGPTGVLVNRALADSLFGGASPLGHRIRYVGRSREATARNVVLDRWYDIVGVVPDFPASSELDVVRERRVYHAAAPGDVDPALVAIRVRGSGPSTFAGTFREITAAVDPNLQIHDLSTAEEAMKREQGLVRLMGLTVVVVMLSVVVLSAAGIYALMSFTVARRRREIGIRAALGADPARVLAGIFSRALAQLGIGAAIGMLAAVGLELVTEGDMFEGQGAVLLPIVGVFMITVGLLAALGPARRGLSIQPTEALREE